jgi:hypothetical protein
MTAVVGVHGVGNLRSEPRDLAGAALAGIWARALAAGPLGGAADRLDLTVAYYADLLRTPGQQGERLDLDGLDPLGRELAEAWAQLFDPPVHAAQGWATWPLRQVVAWIAERRGLSRHLVEAFVALFFGEVSSYLNPDRPARAAAREAVRSRILDHRAKIVIAHSLGSVVTYEALWADPGIKVPLLITLGSPLALPHAVFPRLIGPADSRAAKPPGVTRWVNITDPGDLIAIPPNGVRDSFAGLDEDHLDAIHAFDFHLAVNYLRCATLAVALGPPGSIALS